MCEEHFIGSTKVGSRGQIVLPKAIRKACGIRPGDTVLVIAMKQGKDWSMRISTPERLLRMIDHMKDAEIEIQSLTKGYGASKGKRPKVSKGSKGSKGTRRKKG